MRLSRDPAARRRLTGLVLAAVLALVAGIVLGARAGAGDDRESGAGTTGGDAADAADKGGDAAAPVERLSLRRQVGQITISSFDGTTRPDYIRRRLRAEETAGVILFGRNGGDAAAWRRLTGRVQRAARGRALIMVDQEGGDIRSLPFAGPQASQPLQGDAAQVRAAARNAGRQLAQAGVNVNLAPVADLAEPGSVMASRSFGTDVAAKTAASVEGMRAAGVAATAKHFPGLGGATVNTDDGPATVAGEVEVDLEPFRAAIGARVPLVMLSHALYPALDGAAIASQSKPIVTGLLRQELGFEGVIVTDSMEAQAVLAGSDVATAAERSIEAGADLVLMTGSASWNEVFPRLLERARSDGAFRQRVRDSAARVLVLKKRLFDG